MSLLLGAGEWGWGSPGLLCWSVAIAIPLLLHFWKKRPKQEISWAAMRFLEQAVEEKYKRSQLENWLLLLLRCFAVMLLSLAVARPWLQTGQEITLSMERPPKLVVIVMDRSYSMQHKDRDQTLWDIAKKQAIEQIKQLKKNDAVILYGLSNEVDGIVPSASFDHAAVLKELESTSVTDCTASIEGIVSPIRDSISRSLQRYPHLREVEVGFYSDFGKNTWGNFSFDGAAEELSQGLVPVQIHPVSSLTGNMTFSNVGIRSLSRIGIAKSGIPCSFEVEVERFGGNILSPSTIELIVDKKTVASQTFQVELHGTTTIRLPWTPDHTGNFSVETRLGMDDLDVDNSRWLTVDVKRRRKTLILEQSYQASQYLQVALESEGKNDTGFEVVVKKLARSEPLALEDVDAIVLADVQLSDPNQLRTIRQFVENGGGMMVWTGSNTRSSLASNLFGGQDDAVSPLVLRDIAVNESLGIDPRNYESPVIASFRDFPNSGLLTTPIYRYWKIDPPKDSKMKVDLAFSDGQPLLLHHSFGEGLVYWMLTAPTPVTASNEEWNGLAGWPSFVPSSARSTKPWLGILSKRKSSLLGKACMELTFRIKPCNAKYLTLVEHHRRRRSSPI